MTDTPSDRTRLRVADLPQRKPYAFDLTLDAAALDRLAIKLEATAVRKLSFTGTLRAAGRDSWTLQAQLGASVVQPCVVTLAPVTTRIDQPVTRHFTSDWDQTVTSDDMEMPEDDTTEPLEAEIDLMRVLTEALALALPDYPRADAATLGDARAAPPGVAPLSDEDTKPFAGLAALKDKLENPD